MDTLTKKDKLTLQVSLALVAGMFSLVPVAQGAPVLDKVVSGGAVVNDGNPNPQTHTTVTSQNPNNIINWKDFSVAGGDNGTTRESVTFDEGKKTNNYLNVVTGAGTSFIDGDIKGGQNVYLVNPNGVIMGENAQIDVGNLYVSTKKLTNVEALAKNNTNLVNEKVLQGTVNAEVVNMGTIQANKVYVEGTEIRFIDTADVLYKDITDESSTKSTTLLGSQEKDANGNVIKVNGQVTINATVSAGVGYARRPKGVTSTYKSDETVTGTPVSSLNYEAVSAPIDEYMLVRNIDEFQNISNNPSKNYMLDRNIKYSGEQYGFKPVGTSTPFSGKFEGNYFTISNISTFTDYAGLFAKTNGATIRNLGVVNPYILANKYGGGIVAHATNTTIKDSYVKGGNVASYYDSIEIGDELAIYTKASAVGGIVGYASGSTIDGVYNSSKVTDGAGLVGSLLGSSTLKDSYNEGSISLLALKSGTGNVDIHYSIYDTGDSTGTVSSVYNTGYTINESGKDDNVTGLVNNQSSIIAAIGDGKVAKVENYYVIDTANKKFVVGNGNIYNAASYGGFFATDAEGVLQTKNDKWRIYEGQSLPLLRSFLKANSHGTVALNYNVGLYAEENDTTPRAVIPGSAAKDLTYNGYYMGVAKKDGSILSSNNARGLDSSKIGYNDTKVRDVTPENESGTNFFYSLGGQDGYDLADSSIKVVARNLLPVSGDVQITKVYDGTNDAKSAFGDALTLSDSAVDVAEIYNKGGTVNGITYKPGTLVETGLVKVTNSAGTVLKTDAVTLDTSGLKATYASGENVVIGDNINLIFPDNPDTMLVESADSKNYKFDTTPFETKSITVIGDITKRPVQVSLARSTNIDKIYDGTSYVLDAKDPKNTSITHKYLTDNVTTGDFSEENNTGLVSGDGVTVGVDSAYYSTDGTSNGKVSNANSTANAYKAVYELIFNGNAAKIANYSFQNTNGEALTDNILTGTGTIAKRIVYTTNAELNYQDPITKEISNVDYRKPYDYKNTYNEANHVDFNTTGGTVLKDDAIAQTYTTGVISGDNLTFSLATGTNGPTFYKSDKVTPTSKVAEAENIGYYVKVGGNSAGNYKFVTPAESSTDPGTEITLDADNKMQIFHAGGIDRRELSLKLNQSTGIDKVYDGKDNVIDTDTVAFAAHTDNNSIGNVTYEDDSLKKISADGTAWKINAAYQLTDGEGAAKNVRKVGGVVVENGKNVNYKVYLDGEYADNYTLKVENHSFEQDGTKSSAASFNAKGKINPVTINKVIFGDVSKNYDGTTVVGRPAIENGSVQPGNYITITGVEDGKGNSVLVGTGENAETLADVFGSTNFADDGHYKGTAITGSYGNTVAYKAHDTSKFSSIDGQHAYALNSSTTGASRYVQYTGLSNAVVNDNYVIADDKQYGEGRIDPLTITSLSYNIGASEKVYDGNANLIGSYKVDYNDGNEGDGKVNTATLQTGALGKDTIGDLTGTGSGVTLHPLNYTVNTGSYFAKDDGTATANAGEAKKTVYSISVVDNSGYGDYVLGKAADNSYTNGKSPGVALISGDGSIKPRRVYVDGVTQTKTYDSKTDVTATGDSVVTMSNGGETAAVTGLLTGDQGKNNSTAVYSADAGTGYKAEDANWDTNTNALFRDDDKTVKFTPSLSSNGSNYEFYHAGDGVVNDSFNTTGHIIKQRDLEVTFADIKKTFDGNDYVKTNGDHTVTLTSSGTGDPVYAALDGDTVTLETRNTSQFLPLAGAGDESSVYAGKHDVRYDLKVSGDDYKNYRLVDDSGKALATNDTYYTNNASATGSGVGVIDPASANTAKAEFETITKVYDGKREVTYDHTTGGYDTDQALKDTSYHVTSLTLGKDGSSEYVLNANQYKVLDALYKTADVDNGKGIGITYTFQITDTSFLSNVDLSGLESNYGYNSSEHTFYFSTTGSITPKNIYATLSNDGLLANPTKTYNKSNTVLDLATNNNSKVDQATANSYVSIDGLLATDNSYKVTPVYQNVNVATDDAGNVVTKGNDIQYNIDVSKNYKLYTNDYANRSENQYLIGTGTITPKEVSLSATNVAMKTFDGDTTVKMSVNDGNGVVVPTFAIDTGISGDTITVNNAALSGTYGTYANSAFTPDANVALNDSGAVTYKAVQYKNVDNALTAGTGTLLTNYALASGKGGVYSADDNGTVTFATGKGMINKLALSTITADVNPVTKVYDGTGTLTYDHRRDESYGDENQRNTHASAGDSVNRLVLTPVTGSVVYLDYNHDDGYGYGYTVDNAKTYFNDPNVDTNKTITYTFNIDKDVMNNFDLMAFNYQLNGVTVGSDGNFIKKDSSTGNEITAKSVYATLTDLATSSTPTKVYNGNTYVVENSQSNPTGTAKDVSGYMKVTGLVNDNATNVHDTATITAEYENPDVKGENGSWVKYTATITNPKNYKLFTKNAEGVVVDAEGNATDDVNNVLKGKGTITPKNLTLTSGLALKTYDQTANVKLPGSETEAGDKIPTLGLSGQVADGDVKVTFDANNEEAGGKYGIYENGEFTPDANVAFDGNGNVTYKAVQYKGLKLADGNVAATNYALADTAVFAASEGKGLITKRGISSISAKMEAVTKAYDGNDKVAYDHTNDDDYFADGQNDAKGAVRAISRLTLSSDVGGPFYLDAHDYTVDNNTAVYLGYNAAGAGVGKNAQYRLNINSDVGSNYTLAGAALTGTGKYVSGVTNADGSYTFVSSGNVIEQKKVYASVDPKANPTKTYSGDEVVYGWAKDGDSTVTAETVKDFVKINGLVTGDDNYNVEASYQNKNVATEGEGDAKHVVAEKNYIDYQVSGLSINYELFPEGGDNSSTTVTVTGKGTITPKKLTVTAEKAQKVYDQTANVKMTADDENYETGDTLPDLKVEGLMAEGDVTLNNAKVTGLYLNDRLEKDANVAFDNDGNVAYKAVRYSNLSRALEDGNVAATNYTIGYGKDGTYDAASDTLTFEAEAEKGKITQRAINSVTADIGTVTKVYDGNKSLAYDHTYDDGYRGTQIGQGEAGTAIRNLTFSNSLRDFNLGLKDLTIDEANTHYLTEKAEGGKAVTYQFSVNNDILRNYTLNGVTVNGAENSSVTDGVMNGDGSFTFNTKDNVIEKKNIYASLDNTANPTKVYDGRNVVIGKSVNNGEVIDQKAANDLVSFIGMREGEDSYTVTPTYKNKNVLNAGDNLVDYVISGYSDNYKLYTGGDTPGDTLTGQGTITKRPVYVVDKDGDSVITKEYNGDAKLYLPEGTVLGDRFKLGEADENTGLVVNEVTDDSNIDLDKEAITGIYVDNDNNADKNVARDSSGNAVNKAVKFEGFGLKGEGKDNYFLTAKDTTGTVDLTGEYGKDDSAVNYGLAADGSVAYVTEMEGGRIKPKDIAISVKKSPTKVYNQDQLVKNEYDEDGNLVYDYATASNLEAAADKAVISRSFDTANKSLNLGIEFEDSGEKDSFNVKVEGTPVYEKSRTDKGAEDVHRAKDGTVQQDKVTSYNISWTNQNYNLVGETASDTSDHTPDTFVADGIEGYTPEGGNKRSGVLKDYEGEITPYKLSVNSMNAEKTYNGSKTEVSNPGPDVTVSFGKEADEFISNDIARGGNINDPKEFVGLSVAKGEFGLPTQAAKDEALAEEAAVNKKATEDEVKAAKPWDAAFNRTADPFQHQVAYSGIAITNGNYELDKDEFDGTGTINRAVVTAHPKSATIKAGEAMPSFKGTLDGFMDGETMPKTFYTTVENEDGTTTTTSETRQVPLSEYYNDPEFIYWGPEDGVTNRTEGTNPVYGWYLRKEVGEDKDGNEVVSYYKEKEANLDKNYTLVQAEEPSTLVVEPAPRSGGGGGSGSIVSPPVRESTPVYTTPSVPTPAAPQPQPVLEVGYVEKPVVADSSVYQNVSKDTSNSANNEAQAAIQYGKKGAGIAAGNDDSGKSSTIAIELAEVVNLLGGDVASDGSMSLTNTDSGRKLSVGSTEEGYLSVGAERKEGSIGIETEGENILEEMAAKEGSIGIESEEAQAEVRTEDKEGQIELETEEEMLDAEGKKSSISLRSEGRDGESEITYSDGDLSILNSLNADKKKEQKGEEDEEDSEKSESREGEAAIAYNDVA